MFKIIFIGFIILFLDACSYSIDEIDTSGKNKQCIDQCTRIHNSSINDENNNESKFDKLKAAKYAYKICINACEKENE